MGLNMTFSKKGIALLEDYEKREKFMYPDSGGAPTIGIGHLLTKSERTSGKLYIKGVPVKWSFGLTDQQIDDLLIQDLEDFIEVVDSYVKVPLDQNQFDALVSFAFNVGVGAFRNSTLLKLLNKGLYKEVPTQLRRWNKDNGKVVQGLINRREKEIKLWSTPV